MRKLLQLLIKKSEPALSEISEEQYREIFLKGRKKEEIEKSYQMAWQAKNFEIEHYWKRANYFWAFQIASFAGYFAILKSDNTDFPQILFFIISVGFITSLGWLLINKGSKIWQRHWEIHVDMLEDAITGPLYKVITTQRTFSVSKINEIMSAFFILIWFLLGFAYFMKNIYWSFVPGVKVDWLIILSMSGVILFSTSMLFGYGIGRFGNRKVKFYSRKFHTDL